jgi:NAD(P)-dependent dehydrogenase (short-subunit alcohol dehydrogenase family)
VTDASAALAGRVAVVTGGGSGIGRAISLLFARNGAAVLVADRDGEAAERTADAAVAAEGVAEAIRGDVVADAATIVDAAVERFGALHTCVNNAGVDLPTARSVVETTDADWDLTMSVNVKGVFCMSRAAIPQIQRCGGGTVVNVASVAALVGVRDEAAYAASKGAVLALTRQMAVDFAPTVRVNALCPGMVEAPTRDRAAAYGPSELTKRRAWAIEQPLARYGTHDEIARTALFLASDASSFMTGAALVVDGGMSIH